MKQRGTQGVGYTVSTPTVRLAVVALAPHVALHVSRGYSQGILRVLTRGFVSTRRGAVTHRGAVSTHAGYSEYRGRSALLAARRLLVPPGMAMTVAREVPFAAALF